MRADADSILINKYNNYSNVMNNIAFYLKI